MADKKISQLTAASQVNSDAVFPLSQLVSGSDETLKATVGQIGEYVADEQNFLGLNTTAKDLVGAINEVLAGGGGGGGVTPTFSETVLVDNSSLASSFTFSSDYHNYDFIRFKCYNSTEYVYSYILTTPSSIDAIFSITTKIKINQYATNKYANYTQNGLTWTKSDSRTFDIVEVVGLVCSNAIVTETEIYKAESRSNNNITITTQANLMDFDMIIFVNNSSTSDLIIPCQTIFTPSKSLYNTNISDGITYVFPSYNSFGSIIKITNHGITEGRFGYIVGIKFT